MIRWRNGRTIGIAAGLAFAGLAFGYVATSLAQSTDPAPVPLSPVNANPGTMPAPGVDSPLPVGSTFGSPAATGTSLSPDEAAAVDATQKASDTQRALDALQTSIGMSKDKADALRKEIADLNGDRAKQSAALIAAGRRLSIAEIEVQSMEERLTALANAEKDTHSKLDGADSSISNMLAALERISLNPPPALIVNPQDALGSARGAILISAILPQLRAKADEVVADLKHLQDIKADAIAQQDQLKADYAVLEAEQLRIATLVQAKKAGIDAASDQLTTEEQQVADLGAKADPLKTQIAALTAQASAVSAAAASASPQLPTTTPAAIRTALANMARTQPAIPFANARGYLTPPAPGTDVEDFGANDGLGGLARGVSYTTPPNSPVVAPADGWVVYKGPYLNYGQIVILNAGQDYTVLLAGLDAVTVEMGQFVLEGQKVGTMGSRTIGHAVATSAGVSAPTLYIELRKNNEPVDPSGWWAAPANTTQSG